MDELLEARDRKKFGLVWERDVIGHGRALNGDSVVFDRVPDLAAGTLWHAHLIVAGDQKVQDARFRRGALPTC